MAGNECSQDTAEHKVPRGQFQGEGVGHGQ